ncbi:hypothetical protein CROQUDRAFT_688275 [Cronartium quercuum f. sp. fusiforme G11]|uniref:Uncharacterized protein n=1 Tax=Cronartium quercuum f. sp. fusiforme G11 TaxID=708437 RepID=A0A9P6T6X9_9BASI|nr:hypothetical protein CROQUDRAFT_688275 [Cronartium quercuum f. sp. fusiforme G11]
MDPIHSQTPAGGSLRRTDTEASRHASSATHTGSESSWWQPGQQTSTTSSRDRRSASREPSHRPGDSSQRDPSSRKRKPSNLVAEVPAGWGADHPEAPGAAQLPRTQRPPSSRWESRPRSEAHSSGKSSTKGELHTIFDTIFPPLGADLTIRAISTGSTHAPSAGPSQPPGTYGSTPSGARSISPPHSTRQSQLQLPLQSASQQSSRLGVSESHSRSRRHSSPRSEKPVLQSSHERTSSMDRHEENHTRISHQESGDRMDGEKDRWSLEPSQVVHPRLHSKKERESTIPTKQKTVPRQETVDILQQEPVPRSQTICPLSSGARDDTKREAKGKQKEHINEQVEYLSEKLCKVSPGEI